MMSIANKTDNRLAEKLGALRQDLSNVIRGKQDVIDLLIIALLSGGSVLIEGLPGVGKTTLAKSLATLLKLEFQRIQCTPDLLPADITGFSVFNPKDATFAFRPGPVFTNVLLVDEINRASPRTQSALLEAMAERQVTIEGMQHRLDAPFMVLATQNPVGAKGTFPLPEAQLDRFAFQLLMDYPDGESELDMLFAMHRQTVTATKESEISKAELLQMQREVKDVYVERSLGQYMLSIVQRTRDDSRLRIGCSPRATLVLCHAAQSAAYLSGRAFVLPDDVLRVAVWTLHHRLLMSRSSDQSTGAQISIIRDILQRVSVPI